MSFVIGSRRDFVEGKNGLLPANKSFILGDSNGMVEYSWSTCQERNAERYEATVSGLTWPCLAIDDPMIRPAAHSSRISVVAGQVVTPMYFV